MLSRASARKLARAIPKIHSTQHLPISRRRPLPSSLMLNSSCYTSMSGSQSRRSYATKAKVDAKVEELQELYANAKDEFEIAAEETEKMTVYAEDDRTAAKEELQKLQKAYRSATTDDDKQFAEEVQKRVGHRLRELENAVQAMEEMAQNQD